MPVTRSDAAHLLRRTGLTLTSAQINPLLSLDRAGLINWIFDFSKNDQALPTPADRSWNSMQTLRQWWIDRMITSPRPLEDRLVLFWHNHFTSANRKVSDAVMMWEQNKTFRAKGLGDFNELAKAASIEPAMLFWLDGAYSTKWGPNENFSRELLELFLLGANNGYNESDVRELARAWTGHTVLRDAADQVIGHQLRTDWQDTGTKSIFGVTAPWEGTAVLDAMIVSGGTLNHMRPLVARHIAKKLWKWFAENTPSDALADTLGTMLASTPGMNIGTFLRAMFAMDDFYTPQVKSGLVLDPLSWFVNIHRAAGMTVTQSGLIWFVDQLAMVPFDPPHVAGWKGGESWISASAFWRRSEGAWNLFAKAQKAPVDGGVDFLAGAPAMTPADAVRAVLDRFGEERIAEGSATWNALTALVSLDRTNVSWAQRANLGRTLALSPEFSMA